MTAGYLTYTSRHVKLEGVQDQVALVASVWVAVRVIRPYLSAFLHAVHLPDVDGQGVWLLVYLASVFVLALDAGGDLTRAELLSSALGVTAAAIGADQVEKKTRNSSNNS